MVPERCRGSSHMCFKVIWISVSHDALLAALCHASTNCLALSCSRLCCSIALLSLILRISGSPFGTVVFVKVWGLSCLRRKPTLKSRGVPHILTDVVIEDMYGRPAILRDRLIRGRTLPIAKNNNWVQQISADSALTNDFLVGPEKSIRCM